MKKILALVLALTMILSMSAFAFAETTLTNPGSDSGHITVTVTGSTGDTYAVVIKWENMSFEYTDAKWDADKLAYDGKWETTPATVTVTNNSNVAIDAVAEVTDKDANDGIIVSLTSTAPLSLGIGESDTFELTPDGMPTNAANPDPVAVVKVTITKHT